MIKILIVDDSLAMAGVLKAIFTQEPDFEVVGHAKNGEQAIAMVEQLKPDLVTMDIRMPVMDGLEATRRLMAEYPVPIVVVSASVSDAELQITFHAIEAGALAVVEKPKGMSGAAFDQAYQELVQTVRAMAEVRVVRRPHPLRQPRVSKSRSAAARGTSAYRVLAIGSSTGGPQALYEILSGLPADFPMPIVIAQHISKGFVGGLVTWLQSGTKLNVSLAQNGQVLKPGDVVLAPDDVHVLVKLLDDKLVIRFSTAPEVNGFRPSATPLLDSVAEALGSRAMGCILTGMGEDGATGLLNVRQKGGHTLVQDRESSVVYGMPGAALEQHAVDRVVDLAEMSAYLAQRAGL